MRDGDTISFLFYVHIHLSIICNMIYCNQQIKGVMNITSSIDRMIHMMKKDKEAMEHKLSTTTGEQKAFLTQKINDITLALKKNDTHKKRSGYEPLHTNKCSS